ncbi:MAG: TIGR02206 family membrane protein [Roseiflexaceae bacterium]
MADWWAKDYTGAPFVLWSPPHLVAVAALAALCLACWPLRGRLGPGGQRGVRYALAATLFAAQAVWYVWHLAWGLANRHNMLPLHACTVTLIATIVLLLTRNQALYPWCYFLGIGGAIQGILTPDPGIYGFPHIRFFQVILSHGGLVLAAVYMTVVEGFRPTGHDLGRTLIAIQIYALFAGIVNYLLGTNFMYLAWKPPTASVLDLFGPWPWYLFTMDALCMLICVALYLPFALADWRRERLLVGEVAG